MKAAAAEPAGTALQNPALPDPSGAQTRTPGVYLLTVRLPRAAVWRHGDAETALRPGWYVYAGSAMGGLAGRLGRQLRTSAVRHWHVDHLLGAGRVVDVQALPASERTAECRLAAAVRAWRGAEPVPGFGAGDCACGTHLCRFARRPGTSARATAVLEHLPELFGELAGRYVDYTAEGRDPFRTLVTCALSLRTRDPVTESAAARLLARWRTPGELARAAVEELADCIHSVGMFRQKARRLTELSRQIEAEHGGRVPDDLDQLLALSGVGRKTANLVLSFAFQREAICVDTHVHRLCNRWGLVRTATPTETECELRTVLPRAYWARLNPYLVQHGQQLCLPGRPRCSRCPLRLVGCGYAALRAERRLLCAVPNAPPHPCLGSVLPAG
jgi:endonuclease-3